MRTTGEIEELIIMLKKHDVARFCLGDLSVSFNEEKESFAPMTDIPAEETTYEGKEEAERRINLELFGRQ